MLDNLIIIKTASPELPGEFSGSLQLNTRDIPDQNFFSFRRYRPEHDLDVQKHRSYQGGKTDLVGL